MIEKSDSTSLALATTAMDGGSAGFAGATNRSTAMDGGSAGFAGAINRSIAILGQAPRSLSDLGCPTVEKRISARFSHRFRQIEPAIILNRWKNLTRSRFPSLRLPWMAEVPVLQEQQTGRLPWMAEVPVLQEQQTGRTPKSDRLIGRA